MKRVKKKFLSVGLEVVASRPEQPAATLKAETIKWAKVIRDAKIQVE